MSRISDLTVRAAMDTAGVTRGVQEIAQEMARVQEMAEDLRSAPIVTGGPLIAPSLVPQAAAAGAAAGLALTSSLEASILADADRIGRSAGEAIGESVSEGVDAGVSGIGAALSDVGAGSFSALNAEAQVFQTTLLDILDQVQDLPLFIGEAAESVQQLNTAAGRPPPMYWDEWAAEVRAARAAADEMERAQDELGAATSQSTHWTEESVREQDRLQEEYKQTWLAARQAKQGIQDAGTQTAATTATVDRLGTTSRRSTDGLGRLNNSMVVIARQAANAHPAVGQLVDVIGTFALGTATMVGVLAGLAAIATVWQRITREARAAEKAQEEAIERAKRVQESLQLEDFGPGGQAAADLVEVNRQIDEMRENLRNAEQAGAWLRGSQRLGAEESIARFNDQLSDLVGKRLALVETVRRAEEQAGREREREADAEQRQIERLIDARTRMVELLAVGGITSPFGAFNVADVGGKIEESFRETEELRGHIRSITTAMDELIDLGDQVPQGAIDMLSRLQQALAEADADVQRRVQRLTERWQEFQTMTITSTVTPPQIIIPAIVDPFSLDSLEETFERTTAAIQERVVRGVIDPDAFEQQGREAAQRFNDAILAQIDRLRADGRLAEALELALLLKLDVEVPDDTAFNDTIEAVRNVTSGIRDLADSLGDISPEIATALRSVDAFINGINQVQAGREKGGAIGALSQVSGVLGIAAGVFQIFQGLDAAQKAREEEERRLAQETKRATDALESFAQGLQDATEFDNQFDRLTELTQDALFAAFREVQLGRGVSESQIARDLEALEEFIGANGIEALLEAWRAHGAEWAALADQFAEAAARIEEMRQREIARMMDDIEVRALVAQGRDSEAAALRQAIQHEKELAEARLLGFTEEQLARLAEVQAMEKVAEAAKEVSNALRGVPQGFRILNLELIRFNAMQAQTATQQTGPSGTGGTETGGPSGNSVHYEDHRVVNLTVNQRDDEDGEEWKRRVETVLHETLRHDDIIRQGWSER